MPGGATAAAGRDVEEGRPFFPNDARTLKGSGANARSQRKGPHSSTTSSSASASSSSSCGSSSATSWELLDSTIEAAGLGRLQLRIVSVVLFCYVMEGCLLSMVPLMFPILRKEWGVSNHELAFVGSSFAVGMMLGCFGAALLGDLAGRRRSIQVGLVVIFCAGLGLSFMPSLAGFSAMLGSVGLGIGLLIVVGTTYVCEMMPAAYRGTLIVLSSVATYLGGMICCGIGFGIFHSVGWRWLPAFLVAPFPAILALTSLIPESPRFQLGRGQFEEAAESLAMIAEAADLGPGSAPSAAQLRAGLKVKARGGKEQQRGAVAGAVAGAGMGAAAAAAAAAGSKGNKGKTRRARVCSAPTIRMTTCVSKRNLVTLVPLMAVWFFNNLGKGIFQWIPLYIEEHTTVVKGQDPMDSAFIALVLFAAGGLIGNSILCVMVAQGFGRRILISMMMMLPSVCIVGLAFIKDPQHMMALIPLLEASSSGAGVLYT